MSDFVIWLIAAVTLFFGCWAQSALGFGLAVLSAPVIVLIRPEWVPYVLVMMALPLCVINTWSQRSGLQPVKMIPPMLMHIPGALLGAWILTHISTQWLQVAVSVCVLLAVLVSFFTVRFKATTGRLSGASLISGVMATTTSIGGPPMVLVMQHDEPITVRANLSLYFTFSVLIGLSVYFAAGLLTTDLLLVTLTFLPIPFLGFWVGVRTRPYIDGGHFRHGLLLLSAVAALLALVSPFLNS